MAVDAIFIDFDDTLSPSTWMSQQALSWSVCDDTGAILCQCDQVVRDQIKVVDDQIVSLVRSIMAAQYRLVIVTNSEEGWVRVVCANLMPGLMRLITEEDIRVVSARHKYGSAHPDLPPVWKALVFFDELNTMSGGAAQHVQNANLVCIGDGVADRLAALTLTRVFPSITLKSLKLVDAPSPTQLCRQASFLQDSLAAVITHAGNMDVAVRLDDSSSLPPALVPISFA